jgi:hypothetical protein
MLQFHKNCVNVSVKLLSKKEYFLDCTKKENEVSLLQTCYMKLMMYIGNDLIEAIQLEDDKVRIPGYVGHFKRQLKEKYQELISQFSTPPDFLVTNLIPHSKKPDNKN